LGSFPTLTGPRRALTGVPGYPPDLRRRPPGCQFQPRCQQAFDACTETIPTLALRNGAEVACFLYDEAIVGDSHG
jgi:oligopeptide/dipeptide ABC transporter ATP-binding protein